jgi:hypothetical protein
MHGGPSEFSRFILDILTAHRSVQKQEFFNAFKRSMTNAFSDRITQILSGHSMISYKYISSFEFGKRQAIWSARRQKIQKPPRFEFN